MPFPHTTRDKIAFDISIVELYDRFNGWCFVESVCQTGGEQAGSVQISFKGVAFGALEIMEELHSSPDYFDPLFWEKVTLDRVILALRYKCSNKAVEYYRSTLTFMGKLRRINLGDDDFMKLRLRLAPSTALVNCNFACASQPTLQADVAEQAEKDRTVLVSLCKPGYREVTTLTDFNVIISYIGDDTFCTTEHVIKTFEKFVDLDDDEDVKKYFDVNCRRTLGEAIIKEWVDTEPPLKP